MVLELGKKVFWHSSAHILGEASERRFGCSLCIGPPIESGFYYEMGLPNNGAVQTVCLAFPFTDPKFDSLKMALINLVRLETIGDPCLPDREGEADIPTPCSYKRGAPGDVQG